jgi:protein TonB
MTFNKFVFCVFFGLYVTIVLLFIMQSLIQSGEKVMKEDLGENLVEFVMTKETPQLRIRERNPRPPPPPDMPPPQEIQKLSFDAKPDTNGWTISELKIDETVRPVNPGLVFSDGEYLPIVQVQPVYPRSALMKGLVGWVVIEFTVTARGTVESPFIVSNCAVHQPTEVLVECIDHPNRIFDTAALRAAKKFKYKPKVINGLAVATAGVRNRVTFELDN